MLLAATIAVVVLLVIPLLWVPGYLRSHGVVEWKTRVVGWAIFAGVMMASALAFSGFSPVRAYLERWELWIGSALAIAFAAAWDVSRARKRLVS